MAFSSNKSIFIFLHFIKKTFQIVTLMHVRCHTFKHFFVKMEERLWIQPYFHVGYAPKVESVPIHNPRILWHSADESRIHCTSTGGNIGSEILKVCYLKILHRPNNNLQKIWVSFFLTQINSFFLRAASYLLWKGANIKSWHSCVYMFGLSHENVSFLATSMH